MNDKFKFIIDSCLAETGVDPVDIFNRIAADDMISIHGPEHHMLDGAALLTAFRNAGGDIDLEQSLKELADRAAKMPGAICGMWGVCGAINSTGAALSIIDGTGPLTTDDSWGSHMKFTAGALATLARTGGPRCCKRGAFTALTAAVEYINNNYGVTLESSDIKCVYSGENQQCIHERCPYFK